MRDTTNSDDINYPMQNSNLSKWFEFIVLGELYVFSAALIAFLVLLPAIM